MKKFVYTYPINSNKCNLISHNLQVANRYYDNKDFPENYKKLNIFG